ncbi:methyltransferase domain-containing protein [Kribbella sandramycini]|uniref:Methyltransferase domain-containing protein n=1 Tax=Kribbella sandramycini TaxID=60450 RepID=A0A7Y4KZ03_9ACTN|nr:methyltransferase domain-containing protein [Kribbella sandramycini]MBB6569640.1 SAM-dependent methyltransferase [Kribbella sandramycini]NOL40527.1 methyltransferase domain-containing protein [Kribbella sandramycini]
MTATFDPIVFKQTTRAQWEEAAEAWHRWGPTIEDWLGDATGAMLQAAGIGKDDRVLDVAAGAGGQTLAAARLAGPGGKVLATDISPAILRYAARAATDAGIETVDTLEADGENLSELPEGGYDAAISRVGLIYFPDQQAALAGIRRALRPGGKFSAVVYSTPERNGFFAIPVGIIRRRAELPPPLPGQPGPFSLGAPGVAEQAFAAAGFREITVTAVPSPVRLSSAADCVRFERDSFGALHQMLSRLDDNAKAAAWQEITEQLTQFEDPDGFSGPCEMLVVTGTN